MEQPSLANVLVAARFAPGEAEASTDRQDERGREVLSFIPGTVPWPEEFGLLEPLDRLASTRPAGPRAARATQSAVFRSRQYWSR
jgi:hypothetical protein